MMSQFIFKPFEEMQEADYQEIGFKSGLEVHQQLLTTKKLFCRCPAGKYSRNYNAEILRHMRPTLSELGEYDGTALMEFKTRKEIIYQIHRDTVCTYEMDDTPPFELNDEALDIALEIALLYGCAMVDEIHIARKQYLDGSIPTGFQRTTIVGVDGYIPYKDRKIKIIQLGLEEDACREVSDVGHRRVYLTDRLGMPLIETVTAPEMRTPQEVAEVGQLLRRMVRSTGKVRTGSGAGRQDVNVSVTGGTRVEIKGVYRIPNIPRLTYNEAMRQWNLLRLREELMRRGITPETFSARMENVTKFLRKTRYQPVQLAISNGFIINCVILKGFKDLLRWPTQTDTYFSREISDRVRVIACLTTLPNIVHSDSPGETLASSEWQNVKRAVGATDEDTMVMVWGDPLDAKQGAEEIMIRAKEATIGIPSETRQALEDGTNGFERILPGPNQMYPDTDLPPKQIKSERLTRIQAALPPQIWILENWYRELGVPADTIELLTISPFRDLFAKVVKEWGIPPQITAIACIQYPKRLRRKGLPVERLDVSTMEAIFMALKNGQLSPDGIFALMEQAVSDEQFEKIRPMPPLTPAEIEAMIRQAIQDLKARSFAADHAEEILMGMVMEKVRGRVPGKKVMEMVKLYWQEEK
ncbi:Glu-tRNA(Gln) amidotransferase subunit GatE [candidate division KSB1 bacterium]|nr:Glu-tRNA(Gln) amidotransferase subunit GatE [candidate division KSB1 bacterium]